MCEYKVCPLCDSEALKAIYAGIPVLLCSNRGCNCVWGFWSKAMNLFPFNGWFLIYTGSYFHALWHWLTDPIE